MVQPNGYYQELCADFSKPGQVSPEQVQPLLQQARRYLSQRRDALPEITAEYSLEQIEHENKKWWPTHCEALRQGRGDILGEEYANELVYFCAGGPYFGRLAATQVERNWWAILAQPVATTTWPVVMFHSEVVYCEWLCLDDQTGELIAQGNETWLRRGHQGACYQKCTHTNFHRNVRSPEEFMHWLR